MRYPDSEEYLQQLGKNIRALRKERKFSQRSLGIEALIEKSTIQRIERGLMNCTVKTLLKIANALDIEYGKLFDFEDKEANDNSFSKK